MVVMPGATASFTAIEHLADDVSAAAHLFDLGDDLQTIDILDCSKCLRHHLFYRLIAIDFHQAAA